jgi:hypothetical protein
MPSSTQQEPVDSAVIDDRGEDNANSSSMGIRRRTGQATSVDIRHRVDPRDVPKAKIARRLHLSLSQFELAEPDLFARGFPKPDPTTGMFDLVAVDRWMDQRSHITSTCDLTDLDAARNAQEVFGDRARRLRG